MKVEGHPVVKYVRKSENYKYVYLTRNKKSELQYEAYILSMKTKRKIFHTEREAALQIDKWLILAGKEPINILKRKTN